MKCNIQKIIDSAESLDQLFDLLNGMDYQDLIDSTENYEPRSFDGSSDPDPDCHMPFLIGWDSITVIYLDFQVEPHHVVQTYEIE